MRRDLRKALPALAHYCHITPDMVDTMPYGELVVFLDFINDMNGGS